MVRSVDRSFKSQAALTLAGASPNDAISLQLYRRLVSLIVSGHWLDGTRLPSSRKLAMDVGVSRTTASLALDRLVSEGWAIARPRSGLFVARSIERPVVRDSDDRRSSASSPVPFELSQGAVDCFPHARWSKLQSRVWAAHVPDALYEPNAAGDHGLRSSLVRHLIVTRGIQCSAENIFLVPSTRAAMALTGKILADEVATFAAENPGYARGADSLAERGLKTLAIPVDRAGLVVNALSGIAGPVLAYVTPAAQFPTGVILARARRDELAEWAMTDQHWLFEDDYDWDARFDGSRPEPPLRSGPAALRTFYCQSFSRTLFSSFRLAALVVPDSLRERAIIAQDGIEGASNLPNQLVLRQFIDSGAYAAHLRHLRDVYRDRREALLDIVQPYLGARFETELNPAGLRLVLRCSSSHAQQLASRLREQGVLCSTLTELSASGVADDGIVLGFAAFSVDDIRNRAAQIARAFDD
ncbi:MAG: PLP-dependent aminotransferase family protein [Sphingomicrobium sp.]